MQRRNVWFVRHGESSMAVQRRLSGHNDAELTGEGVAQAKAALHTILGLLDRPIYHGARFGIVSSPVARARQTAEVIAEGLGLPITFHRDLAETDFGQWDRLTFPEIREQWPELFARWLRDQTVCPPGGESYVQTAKRACLALADLVGTASGDLIVVSHSNPIKAASALALSRAIDRVQEDIHLDFGAVSRFEVAESTWTMLSWNEVWQ